MNIIHSCLTASLLSLGLLGAIQAQTVSSLSLAQAKPGGPVQATVGFDNAQTPNCGVKLHWGDGQVVEGKINQSKDVPFVVSHTYAKPGSYQVMVEPKRVGSTLKCAGKNITQTVAVAAAPAAAAPAAAPAPATTPAATAAAKPASACPEGWALAKPGVNKKNQSFTCTAKAGTKIPEPKLSCPGELTYFENSKKGQLGCRV